MHQPRASRFIFLALWTFFPQAISTASSKWVDTLPTFLDANALHEVVVDQDSGDVFVGGRNVLYHLSADLELKKNVSTGPLMDHPGCSIPPYSCSKPRALTYNDAQLMKMVYYFGDTPRILLCGTVYNNLCQVRPIDNLEEYQWVHPYNETLGYVTHQELNYALLERGFDGRLSLFTATQDNRLTRNLNSAPYLSSRVLEKEGDIYSFKYTFQNDSISSAVFIKGSSSRFPMDGGFVYGDFIYFPVLYFAKSIVESRLVRFCTQDPTFRSYAELPIKCHYKGKVIKRFMAAHLGPASTGDGKALYMSFNDDKSGSALCIVEMGQIDRAFKKGPKTCNRDIVGETCGGKKTREIVDFCGSDSSPYIVSYPLEIDYFIFIPATVITAVTVVKQNNETVAIVGPNVGLLIKISMSTGVIISMKDMIEKTENKPFVSPFVLDKQEKHIYLLIKNKVIKYPVATCAIHETCEECFSRGGKQDPLECGWCGGKCAHIDECPDAESNPYSFSRDTCTPQIYQVFPQRGPIKGGSMMKISGTNFGSYINDSYNFISVAGIGCKVAFWNNTQVNCTLGSTSEAKSGPIELHVMNPFPMDPTLGYNTAGMAISRSNFSYYTHTVPRLYGIRPSKGPTSGGTFVTLFGQDLDFEQDKERFVSIHGRLCKNAVFETNKVRCTTGNATTTNFPKGTIAVFIDGVAYAMDKHPSPTFNVTDLSQSFEYTKDPYISYIEPRFTTVSGLINITVSGKQLDSVKYPKLVVKVDEIDIIGPSEFFEDCWVYPKSNGTRMTCRTPSLKGRGIRHPVPRHPHPLVTHVSFVMDNVQKLREFPKHNEDLSRLLYYPDPEVIVLKETETIKKDQRTLEIKGTYLDMMHLAKNLRVRIGEAESCNITSASSNVVLCDLPPTLFSNSPESGTNISVEVFIGSKTYHLGFIELDQQEEGNGLWPIILVVPIIAITLCVIFVVYKLCARYRKKPLSLGELALANRPVGSTNGYRAVRTCASTSSDNPVPVAVTTRRRYVNPVPVSVATPSISQNPVPVAGASSSTDNAASAAVAGSPSVEMPFVHKDILFPFMQKNLIILEEDLILGEQIGTGHFGCVNEGFLQLSNQTDRTKVAVKRLQEHFWNKSKAVESLLKEAELMKDFHHPNVLGLIGVCFIKNVPCIVLPFMENGGLHSYLVDEDRKEIFVVDLLKFAVDIAAGMSYLETNKFVHRDLAARNCLLDSFMTAKVADFGLSRDIYEEDVYCQGSKGQIPIRWSALESLKGQVFSTKSDVWAYGVLLWELMTRGSFPYSHIDNFDILKYLSQGYRLDQPEHCPLPLYDVMMACWNTEPRNRPSFDVIHVYVRKIKAMIEDNMNAGAQPAPGPVPAKHTEYYNSEELYRSMEGRPLNSHVLRDLS